MIKNLLLSAVAAITLTTAAGAGDLPSKQSAPAPTPVASTLSSDTTLSFGFAAESNKDVYDTANKYVYTLGIERNIGNGFFVGGNFGTDQVQPNNGAIKQQLEGVVGYKAPLGPITAKGSVGFGERFTEGNNFPYYVARLGADYRISDSITWNAAQYRYRSAFDTSANGYESHQFGTGLTYNFLQNQALYANIYRNFDGKMDITDNGLSMGYKVSF